MDITQDGHFAIFGDAAVTTTVEVSDISSGKLDADGYVHPWRRGERPSARINSATVRLSPDESLIYIGNSQSGYVTAAFSIRTPGK